MGADGRGLNGGVRQRSRCAAVAGPFRDSLVAVDDLQRVAAWLTVTGIGSIAQRFARAVVQHQECCLSNKTVLTLIW